MKTLISALTLITLITAPAFAKAAAARPDVGQPNYSRTFNGYSVDEWFKRLEQW